MITVELITALFSHVDEQLCGAAPKYPKVRFWPSAVVTSGACMRSEVWAIARSIDGRRGGVGGIELLHSCTLQRLIQGIGYNCPKICPLSGYKGEAQAVRPLSHARKAGMCARKPVMQSEWLTAAHRGRDGA